MKNLPDYNTLKYGTKNVLLPDGHILPVWYCNGTGNEIRGRQFFGLWGNPVRNNLSFKIGDKIKFDGVRYEVCSFDGNYASHGLVEFTYLRPLTKGNPRPQLFHIGKIIDRVEVIPSQDVTGMVPVHEAARLWGIREKDVRKLLRRGELKGVKDGKEWLVETHGIEIEVSE